MVALKNPHKRPVTFSVTHPDAPRAATSFAQVLHDRRTGELATRKLQLNLPNSITVLAGESREGIPDYALADALRAGLLQIQDKPADADVGNADDKPQIALKQRKHKGET